MWNQSIVVGRQIRIVLKDHHSHLKMKNKWRWIDGQETVFQGPSSQSKPLKNQSSRTMLSGSEQASIAENHVSKTIQPHSSQDRVASKIICPSLKSYTKLPSKMKVVCSSNRGKAMGVGG